MDYDQLNKINSDIRYILDISREVNMAALNATLVARQAGDSQGFRAVSGELRGFSKRLSSEMESLSRQVFLVSWIVSNYFKQQHRLRLLNSSQRSSATSDCLTGAIDRISDAQQQETEEVRQYLRHIFTKAESSLRLCNTGRALARSAMIEASHSSSAEDKLKVVARDIEHTINTIYQHLKSISSNAHNIRLGSAGNEKNGIDLSKRGTSLDSSRAG